MKLFLGAVPTASAVAAGATAGSMVGEPVSVSVLLVQKGLKARGFDPGPLDGEWGPLTEAAYRRWGGTTFTVSADKRTVTVPASLATGLRTLSAQYDAGRATAVEQTIGPHLDAETHDEITSTDNRLWWGLGAGALVLVGLGVYYSRRRPSKSHSV